MKIFGISILILLLATANLLLMDIMLGFKLSDALLHLLNPFWVMSSAEYVMLTGLFLIVIGQQIFLIIKKKEEKRNNS
ncbi:hypothetical protein [Priestia aryabhattai]|uniref:hypothetical protein n=1 Tax=Priestia aryabhattai TaxID=412384 RepID=UPI000881E54C|nr:hypothetical protein SAMN04487777_12319 [Priestia aryabhattai B8W22]